MKFLDYIKGSREGKDAHALEKEAMSDPFLNDAIDGYDNFPDINPEQDIDKIREHVRGRRILSRKSRLGTISVAAMLFLLIGGGYFFIKHSTDFKMMYQTDRYVAADKESKESDDTENLSMLAPATSTSEADYLESDTENIRTIEDRVEAAFNQNNMVSNDLSSTNNDTILVAKLNDEVSKVKDISINSSEITSRLEQNKSSISRSDRTSESIKEETNSLKITDADNYSNLESDIGTKSLERDTKRSKLADKDLQDNVGKVDTSAPANPTDEPVKKVASPEPTIGYAKYKQYLKSNLKRSENNDCDSIKGVVVLEFTVSESGRPTNVKVAKSLCSALDSEAIRLLNSGSDWTISKHKGKLKVQF